MTQFCFYTKIEIDGGLFDRVIAGYTDGKFNYYKNDNGDWIAVNKDSGKALTSHKIRIITIIMAHLMGALHLI